MLLLLLLLLFALLFHPPTVWITISPWVAHVYMSIYSTSTTIWYECSVHIYNVYIYIYKTASITPNKLNHVKNSHFFVVVGIAEKKGEEVVVFLCVNSQNLRHILYIYSMRAQASIYILYLYDTKDVSRSIRLYNILYGRDADIRTPTRHAIRHTNTHTTTEWDCKGKRKPEINMPVFFSSSPLFGIAFPLSFLIHIF